ncbi:MAG: branched-chain amino acid ABC transporter permease [Thermofilaceae archaeon]
MKLSIPKLLSLSVIIFFSMIPMITNNDFILHLLIMIFLMSIVCGSWDLSMGYLGLFNFGHLAFFAIGGYFSGILSLFYGFSPWLSILLGSVLSFILGLLLSFATLRVSHFTFSLISFAFQNVFLYWVRSGGGPAPGELGKYGLSLTGGTQGLGSLIPIPPLQLGSIIFDLKFKIPTYYFTLAIFILAIYGMFKIVNSRFGLAAIGLRDSQIFSKSLGINPIVYTSIFVSISTFFAGLAGALYAHIFGVISPEVMGWSNIILTCCIVEFGGLGTLLGPVSATFLLITMTLYLAGLAVYRDIILAMLMFFTLLVWPSGLAGMASWFKKYFERTKLK